MKKVRFFLYFFTLSCVVFLSCQTQKVNQTSDDRLYKKDNNELNAQYLVYHVNDSISQLFYEVSNEVLVYKKTDTSNFFYSHAKLLLKISTEDNLDVTYDTASLVIQDRQSDVKIKTLSGTLLFKLKSGLKYHVEVNVYDVNKKTRYAHSLLADKTSKNTRQNFLITDYRNNVFFASYYKPQEVVYIRSDRNPEKLFLVDYFKPQFKLSPPPFSTEPMPHFSYKPDSSFSIYSNDNRFELTLPNKGFYHIKTNENSKEGVTFFIYEASFPKIKNAEQMIFATRFIMAKKEFDNCLNNPDKKTAIDNFWIELSGSNERAKQLIKKYYGRVQEANKLFSSFQEGWKTDRGMIYIVFGAPNKVTKRKNGEIWTYGETGNPNSIVFSFINIINPFTDNDFYLERNEILKMPWYQAVDMWRQGRIYLDN
jgi:GWxTD domain-containing protein